MRKEVDGIYLIEERRDCYRLFLKVHTGALTVEYAPKTTICRVRREIKLNCHMIGQSRIVLFKEV